MAIGISLVFSGLKALNKAVKEAENRQRGALGAALYQMGFEIAGDAVKRTPVATGRLRSTAYVSPPQGDEMEVQVGFGTDYAEAVHERTEVNHTVGEAKFLQNAVDKISSGFARNVSKKAQKNFERGVSISSVSATVPQTPKDKGSG
jgi:hypothetical protein